MRIKTYIKQAWALLRQNRLFSALYIVGTGLAVGMTTIMAVIYYVKLAPVYPEVNRFHTYRIASASFGTERHTYQASLSYQALQDWALGVENARVASADLQADFAENCYIQRAELNGEPWDCAQFDHAQFIRGGKLELWLGDQPQKEWGRLEYFKPEK